MKAQSVALFVTLLLCGCGKEPQQISQIERGKYLVMVGGCNDCHTPKKYGPRGPELDDSRLLSGHPADENAPEVPQGVLAPDKWVAMTNSHMTAWAGPWGVSFASNLTPDPSTGIGDWPEAMFIETLRKGKFMGMSRDILPPMPWQTIGKMTDEDLNAIFAYLKSLPAINNKIPPPIPPQQMD